MSRWIELFETHPFQGVWADLKNNLTLAKIDDETVSTSVKELARLKRVISYIDGMVNSVDPELVPSSTWDSFQAQAIPSNQQILNFNSNKNIAHISAANTHADNLLTYIRPYMVVEGRIGKVLKNSIKSYSESVNEYIDGFKTRSDELLDEIKNKKEDADNLSSEINNIYESVNQFNAKLFGDEESTDSIESKIDGWIESIEKKYDEINTFHDETLVGEEGKPSTEQLVTAAKGHILSQQEEINEILEDVSEKIKNLESFHKNVFGKLNVDGEYEGGVSQDFAKRVSALGSFETKQSTRYAALNAEIENLLPRATSAGLSTAYRQMKNTFARPIQNAEYLFYGAIAALVVASLFFAVDSAGWLWIKLARFENWDTTLKALVNKLPLYGALIWLAYFASKRRSEYSRLQQEYAHKEALAKSYNSYKKQIELLDDEDQSMQKEFITKAVDAIAYNASQTLDGKHGDNHPTQDLLGKVFDSVSTIKSVVTGEKAAEGR